MLFDGDGWHRAKELRVPETIKLIPLPAYSQELNPVEHIWEYLRENIFKNFVLQSLNEIIDLLADGLKFLSQQPEIVRSMTCFDWFNTLCLTYNYLKRRPRSPESLSAKSPLKTFPPPIWRRLLVAYNTTLARLHGILQIAMSWTNSHLHAFILGNDPYGGTRITKKKG